MITTTEDALTIPSTTHCKSVKLERLMSQRIRPDRRPKPLLLGRVARNSSTTAFDAPFSAVSGSIDDIYSGLRG